MSSRVCAVTGANGFLGSALVEKFRMEGWKVHRLVRRPSDPDDLGFALGQQTPSAEAFRQAGVQVLIHCAYDFTALEWEASYRSNVQGSQTLFESALRGGAKRIILVSSISAFDGCVSIYGKTKLATENLLHEPGFAIVRPGLIYDRKPEGLVGKMAGFMRRFPLVPLIGSGHQSQHTCHRADLAALILGLASNPGLPPRGPIVAASENALPFREVLRTIGAAFDRRPRFVPLPATLLRIGLSAAEKAGLRLGFRSDSILSIQNPCPSLDFKVTRALNASFRELSVGDFR